MNWVKQSAIFLVLAALCALGTRWIAGEYDRSIPCDPSQIEPYEVCMATVQNEWNGDVLWIDARGRDNGKSRVEGALEISENHLNEDLGNTAQAIFKANNESRKVVVFCQTDACGSSQFVRQKIIDNMLHDQVYVLHGGWKAYHAEMKK